MTLSPEQGPRSVHGSMSINTSLGHDALNAGRQKTSPMAELLERRRCAMAQRHIGITLQIDVGPEVFDAKHSNLHPLFQKGPV